MLASVRGYPAELPESQVKAAFLFNFIKFVDWPANTFPKPGSPMVACFLASDELASEFEELTRGKDIGGRTVSVRRPDIGVLGGCHVVYVGAVHKKSVKAILEQLRGQSVLTVADMEDFARGGGVINFMARDHKLRFIINPEAGVRAGLRISSKLLSLATIVHAQGDAD